MSFSVYSPSFACSQRVNQRRRHFFFFPNSGRDPLFVFDFSHPVHGPHDFIYPSLSVYLIVPSLFVLRKSAYAHFSILFPFPFSLNTEIFFSSIFFTNLEALF